MTKRMRNLGGGFELLEDRCMYAVDVTFAAGELRIIERADSVANDVVDVRQDDSRNLLQVSVNGVPRNVIVNGVPRQSLESDDVGTITAKFGVGNDTFNYRLLSDQEEGAKTVDVVLGAGNDAFNFYGNHYDIRADLTLKLNAGSGNDTFWGNPGGVDDANLTIFADLGSGDDRLPFFLHGDIEDDANVNIEIRGGSGDDILSFVAVDDVDIDSDARLSVKLDGGLDDDRLAFYYRGENDGRLERNLLGDGVGIDTAIRSLTFDPGSANPFALGGLIRIDRFEAPEVL